MKYSIMGFQQDKLVAAELDVEDALLLRMIKDMYSSASMEFIDENGERYMWINYTYLVDQLPILGTKRNVKRKIERYGNELYILRLLKKERKGIRGNFSYICPTEKLDALQDFDLRTESPKGKDEIAQGLGQNRPRLRTESPNKDTSFKDYSKNDSSKHISEVKYFEDERLNNSFLEFIEYRKEIKKAMAKTAITKAVNNINKSDKSIQAKIDAIEKSILNGWAGIFLEDSQPTKQGKVADF